MSSFSPSRLFISTNPSSDILKLIFIATLFTGFFLFTSNYESDSDGSLFIRYAEALTHGVQYLNADVARYDIAYPFLLWLSGYTHYHSLIGITLIHAMMAILMPMLIYLTVRPAFARGAYYIALAAIFSLVPFYYMKWLRPDHTYMFLTVLSFCLLSLFIDKKRAAYLYAMTFAVIAASLSRSAGNIMFPLFITLAFLFGRGSVLKYVVCMMMMVGALSLYSHHRQQFFSSFGEKASFNGGQTFQNLYVNSREFGIRLSPDIGPAMKKLTDNLYQALLPQPALSSFIRPENNAAHAEFLQTYVYPFSVKAFMQQIYDVPCWDYNAMLYGATNSDALFFAASIEIIRSYPWYPVAYTARNMWHLLYRPGYAHTRYNVHPFSKTGIQDAFPFSNDASYLESLPSRTVRELSFDNFDHKFHGIEKMMRAIRYVFCLSYLKVTKILFYFIAIAWIAAGIDLLSRCLSSKKLKALADLLLPKKVVTAVIVAMSIYLLQSMLIISVFVDPMVRFHNHIIPFKIMLAGLGVGIFWQLYRGLLKRRGWGWQDEAPSAERSISQTKNAILVGCMITCLLAGWGIYIA